MCPLKLPPWLSAPSLKERFLSSPQDYARLPLNHADWNLWPWWRQPASLSANQKPTSAQLCCIQRSTACVETTSLILSSMVNLTAKESHSFSCSFWFVYLFVSSFSFLASLANDFIFVHWSSVSYKTIMDSKCTPDSCNCIFPAMKPCVEGLGLFY